MKQNKGITLISLVVYIIGMVVIIAMVGSLLSFYNNNMVKMNDTSDVNMELSKFTARMMAETKDAGNEISEVTGNTIKFKNGNVYTYQDNRIYENTMVVSQYVKDYLASLEVDGSKQILRIHIVLQKGETETTNNLTYVIEETNEQVAMGPTYVIEKEGTLATENVTIKPREDSNIQIAIPAGFGIAILEGSNSTTSLPGQSGKVKKIMPNDEWDNITIEQINQGIVVVDHAITYTNGVPDFNEFVWVPIPTSDDFDREAWTTKYGYDANGNWIEGTGVIHPLADTSIVNNFWEEKTTTEYTNMITSVKNNKGFYIGRYEASLNGTIAQSKRGQIAKVSISQLDAISACTSNTSTNNMHLIYGIEWDSTLNWLKGDAIIASSTVGTSKTMELSDIQTNSSSWGNYTDSNGDSATNAGSIRATGYSEYWKANNIYDLAGNVQEWTQEKKSTEIGRAYRGGGAWNSSERDSVASRYGNDESREFNLRRLQS